MDIFNSNRRLEELVMFGLDWGMFDRHDLDAPGAPVLFLKKGEEQRIRMLMSDDNPLEFAKRILQDEEFEFEQYMIIFEGFLRDNQNNRQDAIVVQGFDISQPTGVSLAQAFLPKEKGGFKRLEKPIFMGNPESLLAHKPGASADYSVEEPGFNAVAIKADEGLTAYMSVIVHENPSVITNTIKRFLRSKIAGNNANELSGKFDLLVPPGTVKNQEFLNFLVKDFFTTELPTEPYINWERSTKRKLDITCKYGEEIIYTNNGQPTPTPEPVAKPTPVSPGTTTGTTLLSNEQFDIIESGQADYIIKLKSYGIDSLFADINTVVDEVIKIAASKKVRPRMLYYLPDTFYINSKLIIMLEHYVAEVKKASGDNVKTLFYKGDMQLAPAILEKDHPEKRMNYRAMTEDQLNDEYYSIFTVPNAPTNPSALLLMNEILKEYKNRGVEPPDPNSRHSRGKKWWQFWK